MSSAEKDPEQPFVSHLLELRDRLLRMIIGILVVFAVLLPFANDLFEIVSEPLRNELPVVVNPDGSIQEPKLLSQTPIGPFLVPLKLVLILSIFATMPWILYQFWAFIAPGLYLHEQKLVIPLVVSSTILFYCGMAFAYFVVLPLFSAFMAATTPGGVLWMPDINIYVSFLLLMSFSFGLAFEVPVATILLCLVGVTTPDSLASKRAYIFIGAFVVGMLLTPPDVISQTLLALPMWVLFEIGVFLSRIMLRRKANTEGSNDSEMDTDLDEIEREEAEQDGKV